MSTREMAIELVSSLSDEQVQGLIDFIKGFADSSTKKKLEEMEREAEQKDLEERRRAYEELNGFVERYSGIISEDVGDDYKGFLARCREEKYGV